MQHLKELEALNIVKNTFPRSSLFVEVFLIFKVIFIFEIIFIF